jgi:hypothetical protein
MEQQEFQNNTESFDQSVNQLYSNQAPIPPITGLDQNFSSNPVQVEQKITGKTPGRLPSQTPPGTAKSFDPNAYSAALREYIGSTTVASEDKNDWGKAYNYNSGPTGFFYDRYAKIEQPGKLEFSPLFSDNESYLNANTNFAGDFYRSLRYSTVPLFWEGVKSSYRSNAKILQGDFFSPDKQGARDYAYYTGLTYSTKDNLGSFVNNLWNNFSYTAGIMATAMAENFVGSAFTGAKALTQKSANLMFREFQTGKKSFDGMKTYTEMLDELKDINKVREQFYKAQGVSKWQRALESPVGRTINPFSNLTDNYYAIANSTDDFAGYFGAMKNFASTAGAAYRDFRNIGLAISEARLEGGMVYNNIFDEIYNDYYTKTGKAPDDKELAKMIDKAKRGAYETAYMNTGLIYFTNKIAFDNILNPRIGTRGFLGQRIKDWKSVGGGKFGELGTIGLDMKDATWKFYDKGFKTWYSRWKTDPFAKSVFGTVGYFKRNITEGLQESLQETIAYANENYYKDAYYTGAVKKNLISRAIYGENKTPFDYYSEGLYDQFSTQGASVFLSGFAMGSLAGGLNKVMTHLYEKSAQIFDPKGYEEYVQEKEKITTELVDRLNSMSIKEWADNKLFNGGTQQILASVQNDGTKKEVMDAESEAMVQHIMTLHDYGVLDMQLEAFESMKQMTDAEFKEAFPKLTDEDVAKYKGRIDDVVSKGRKIQERLNGYLKVYPNPIDLSRYSKDDEFYEEAYIMHHMWNFGIKSAVFYNETFDDVRDRMTGIMNKFYSERPLQSMTKRQSDIILRPEELKNEIGLLGNEITNLLAVGDPESKELAKEKKKLQTAYQKYYDAYSAFSMYYNRDRYYNKAKLILQQEKGEGEEVTDEEIQEYLDSEIGPKSKEAEEDLMLNLEKEFNNLLRSLSGKPDDYLFTDNVDKSFEMVLDFYKLNDESREMVDYINLMNDPEGYMDVFNRNVKWMTDLWLKRGDYYREIVTKELSDIEDNGVLNALAQQGIFVDLNDYIQWRDQGVPPREFYDQKKQLVIPEGSLAYDRYFGLLENRKQLDELVKFAKGEAAKADIDLRIAQLIERRDAQLAKVEALFEENLKETTGETREEWEKKQPVTEGRTKEEIDAEIKSLSDILYTINNSTSVEEILALYEALAQQGVLPDNFAEIADEEAAANETELKKFFKSTKDSGFDLETRQQAAFMKFALPRVLNDKIAEVSQEEPVSETDKARPIETTKAWQDYQINVKKITDRYEALISKLRAQKPDEDIPSAAGTTPKATTRKPSTIKVTTETPFDELPEDFKTELEAAFDAIVSKSTAEGGLGQPADIKKSNLSKYELLRNNWFEQQQALIDEYNSRTVSVAAPELEFVGLKKSISDIGITTLVTLRKELNESLDKNTNPMTNQKLTDAERAAIKHDIKVLDEYITFRRQSDVPKNDKQRVFRVFEEMVLNQQNKARRILDEKGQTIGYELEGVDGRPIRVTLLSEKIELDMTPGKKPFKYGPIEEPGVDEEGREQGQLINLFREINTDPDVKPEERVKLFISSLEAQVKEGKLKQLKSSRKIKLIKEALTNNFTEDALKAVVKSVAYDESTTAGNSLDGMIRTAFRITADNQFEIPVKPDKMSQEAYDNLFGEKGIITELQDRVRDGRYTIFSSDAMVFDSTLTPFDETGIIGAMDLVVFDNETNRVGIIDIKTGQEKNWTEFNNPKSKYSKKLNYRLQQSIYRALLFNMTGELADISLMPIAITVDMDGNITSAKSVAKTANQDVIRALKAQLSSLQKAAKPDADKIRALEQRIKSVERSNLIILDPVEGLEKYGIILKQPDLPENLKPEAVGKTAVEDQMTPELAKKEISKLKGQLTRTNNKIAKIQPLIPVGDKVMESPEMTTLLARKAQLEAEIARLQAIVDGAVKAPVSELTADKVLEILTETSKKFGIVELNKDNSENIDQEYIVQQIKDTLNTLGLPYKDVVAIRKSTYNVINSKGESIEILKLLQMGGAPLPAKITAAKYLNSLTKEEKIEYARRQLDAELATSEINPEDEDINASLTGKSGIFKPATEPVEDPEYIAILDKMQAAKDIDELDNLYSDALLMILDNPELDASLAENIRAAKTLALKVDVSEENLKPKDYLISKNPIFGTQENEVVVVKEVKDGKVVVKQLGVKNPRQKTFTDAQIKAGFIKTTEEALNQQEMVEPVTDEQKDKAKISKSSITDLGTDPELLAKAKKAAEQDSATRFGNLKKASDENNINKCD